MKKKITTIILPKLAKLIGKSSALLQVIRRLNFKKKATLVNAIKSEYIRKPLVFAYSDKIRYKLDLRDDMQRNIYLNVFDYQEIPEIKKIIHPGAICFDIGANVGFYSLHFAKYVGENGYVYAFEADPDIYHCLEENCQLNSFEKRIKRYNFAVPNHEGHATFYKSSKEHSGWGSLTEFKDIAFSKINIKTVTLDGFLISNQIDKVDFLKIDVEANEIELLEGAKVSLSKRVFEYIMIEFNGVRLAQKDKTFMDFVDPFLKTGYEPIKINLDVFDLLYNQKLPSNTVCLNFLFHKS